MRYKGSQNERKKVLALDMSATRAHRIGGGHPSAGGALLPVAMELMFASLPQLYVLKPLNPNVMVLGDRPLEDN